MIDNPFGLAFLTKILLIVVMPIGVAVFFGLFAWRGMTPHVFLCRRCGATFLRPPHRGFPARCARCRSRDWNAVDR